MIRTRAAALLSLAFLAGLTSPGCGGKDAAHASPTVPVKGKVTYKGRPLTQGSLTFEPEGSGRAAHGEIRPDGTFVLTTFREGDGAVPGTHRIAFSATSKAGKAAVPVKFRNFSSSKVQVEVSESKTAYAIDLN